MNGKTTSVHVENLNFTYKSHRWAKKNYDVKPALVNISFKLTQGEITGLVGESGSGKTTLAKCLNGLLKPQAKRLEVEGFNLLARRNLLDKRALRAKVQLVFQESEDSFNPRWKLIKSIEEPLRVHKHKKDTYWHDELVRLLNLFGLSEQHLTRLPKQVSGGELQRLAIIRAMLLQPSILIADEPFSALDIQARTNVLSELEGLCKERGTTLLLITHDIILARNLCNQLLVLLSGVLVEKGEAHKVGGSKSDPYTKKLLSAVPEWRKPLPRIERQDTS